MMAANTETFYTTAYTADGENISYVHHFSNTDVGLAVQRRDIAAFQNRRVTPLSDRVVTYRTDPTGYVSLVGVQGSPGRAVLVNLDLPMVTLPIGTTGVNFTQFAVVPR